MIISSFLLGGLLDRELQKSFENRLNAELKTFSLILNTKEKELVQGLSRAASDNTLQMTLNLEIIPQLRKYLDTQIEVLGFSSLVVADVQKKILATSGKTISNFIEDNDESQLITVGTDTLIGHSRPIFRNNELLGYVLGAVSLEDKDFLAFLSEKLVDNFAIWNHGELVASDLTAEDLGNNFQFSTDGNIMKSLTGEIKFRVLTEKFDFGNRELTYGILLPLEAKAKKFRTMLAIIAAFVLSLFLIILTLLKRFMVELINPVNQLTRAASNIDKGEEIPYLDDNRNDEFGKMAFTFKRMVENLKNSKHELQTHRDNLQDLVKERTADLEKEIGERMNAEERISYMAFHDSLTGLPNRYLFQDRLTMSIAEIKRRKSKVAVLFLDIDDFKRINDTFGHNAGDLLLKGVAKKISNCIRSTDSVTRQEINHVSTSTVARIGGDEFTVLLTNLQNSHDVVNVAQRIIKAVSHPFHFDGHEVYVTVSIGIAVCPDDGKDAGHIMKNADTALYHAKDRGKNNFQFYKIFMNDIVQKRLVMENELRKAIYRNEMLVYYQPRIDIRTGAIISMEALARWKKPDEGLVSPAEFIPVAEDSGLIIPIGEWILETACKQNKTWQKSGFPALDISVNISVKQFQHESFLATISDVLEKTSLDPRHLELEITENILMQDTENTIDTLNKLKSMGIRFAIDDFGVGYSSFNYLIRFPLDIIKIDISFIRNITERPEHAAIVKAIISMAHSLNLTVVAEGVETEQQLSMLQQFGCDEIQGYYYSPPVPDKEFTELLEKSVHQPLAAAYINNGS
jgi:diguanylate cyclase (GGDEF)-like protein